MSRYRRAYVEGGVFFFFFTVTLANRSSDILVRHIDIDRPRRTYMSVQERYPFQTIAICVLPDHLHAVWSLPQDDADFSLRWSLIKSGFSRGLPGDMQRSSSKIARREMGIWQRRHWEYAICDDADLERQDMCPRLPIGRIAAPPLCRAWSAAAGLGWPRPRDDRRFRRMIALAWARRARARLCPPYELMHA